MQWTLSAITVDAYQQDELPDGEKDAKWFEEAEKAVELKNHCKRKQGSDKERWTHSSLLASGCRSFRAVLVFHCHSIHATTVLPANAISAVTRPSSQGTWALFSVSAVGAPEGSLPQQDK